MTRQLDLLDNLAARGREAFTFDEARDVLGVSPAATANTLRRLSEQGLVDRLTRGHYAIRPLGSLGTSAATDNLPQAVGAAFAGRDHRIAYLTALSELGLLTHPVRTVFVACTQQVRYSAVGRRRLRVVIERPDTIHMDADLLEHSWISTLNRALFESAMRVDLTGGVNRLAEAVAAGAREANPHRIAALADAFGPKGAAAQRRLASLTRTLELPLDLTASVDKRQPVIRMDPRDEHVAWIDPVFRVAWNETPDELRAVTRY